MSFRQRSDLLPGSWYCRKRPPEPPDSPPPPSLAMRGLLDRSLLVSRAQDSQRGRARMAIIKQSAIPAGLETLSERFLGQRPPHVKTRYYVKSGKVVQKDISSPSRGLRQNV